MASKNHVFNGDHIVCTNKPHYVICECYIHIFLIMSHTTTRKSTN